MSLFPPLKVGSDSTMHNLTFNMNPISGIWSRLPHNTPPNADYTTKVRGIKVVKDFTVVKSFYQEYLTVVKNLTFGERDA